MADKVVHISLTKTASPEEVRTLVIKDIKVPEKFFKRTKMEVSVLDELFGGQDWPGILPGTSILFTGMPGAGKSTAALQFADLLQRNAGRNILYNTGEESEYMIKLRADRLGIAGNFGLSVIDDLDLLVKVCLETGVETLFQDSLQSLLILPKCGRHEFYSAKCPACAKEARTSSLPRAQMLKAVTKRLHRFAKEHDVNVWIIGHITKGGDFAGPMEVKHDVDVHAHIRLNPDTMAREFMLTKNRFGPAGIPYECNLTAKGLDFAAMALVENKGEEKKEGGKALERREAYEKLIREALLGGDRVSAYCQGRFKDPLTEKMGVGCSPGVWRALLEKVVSSLQAEGHIIGTEIRDSRRHYFVEV